MKKQDKIQLFQVPAQSRHCEEERRSNLLNGKPDRLLLPINRNCGNRFSAFERNKTLFLFFLLLSATLSSCTGQLKKDRLVKYINNPRHGLVVEKNINSTKLKATYRPSDMLAWQEIQSMENIGRKEKKEVLERYSKQYYFVLSVSQGNKEILSSAAGNRTSG